MKNNVRVRDFEVNDQTDYQIFSDLYNLANPHERTSAIGLRIADNLLDAKFVCRRFAAELNGVAAGVASFAHWQEFYHPHKYLLHVLVDSNFQNRGVGTMLVERALTDLEKLKPETISVWVRETDDKSIYFAEKHGFTRNNLRWQIVLDVKTGKLDQFLPEMNEIRRQGIEVRRFSELTDDPERYQKLYDFYVPTINSIESVQTVQIPSFREFVENQNGSDGDLMFVALHENRCVGMWQLENALGNRLFGAAMGVAPEYRRRNVALALTFHAISFAQSNNYAVLNAHTDEHNRAILALAKKLGFTHLPAQLLYAKQC